MCVLKAQFKGREAHLTNLFEGFRIKVGKDVAVWLREYLEGHSAVMVLQRRDVIVPHGQLCARINLIPGKERGWCFVQGPKTLDRCQMQTQIILAIGVQVAAHKMWNTMIYILKGQFTLK